MSTPSATSAQPPLGPDFATLFQEAERIQNRCDDEIDKVEEIEVEENKRQTGSKGSRFSSSVAPAPTATASSSDATAVVNDMDAIEEDKSSDGENCLHPDFAVAGAAVSSGRCSPSNVSLYQQQKRVRLSIPCEPCNPFSEDDNGASNSRANLFKRRSAVHGLSPNTGLNIGTVMWVPIRQFGWRHQKQKRRREALISADTSLPLMWSLLMLKATICPHCTYIRVTWFLAGLANAFWPSIWVVAGNLNPESAAFCLHHLKMGYGPAKEAAGKATFWRCSREHQLKKSAKRTLKEVRQRTV